MARRFPAMAAFVLASITFAGVSVAAASAGEPAAPTGLAAAVAPAGALGSGDVQLKWNAPADDGGSAITDYLIQRSTDGEQWFTYLDRTGTTFTAHMLPNGVPQRFRVAAENALGLGPWSDPVEATPLGWPAAPDGLVARASPAPGGLSGEVRLTWSAPTDTGGTAITDYVVESLEPSGWTTIDDGVAAATTFTVRGLTDGTSYTFRVAATTTVGTSAWSSTVTATPGGPPAPPGGLTAAGAPASGAGSGEVKLTWTAPVAGTVTTDYVIQYSADLGPWTPYTTVDDGGSTATTYTVGGLTNGTNYAFHVAAVNGAGLGWWSDTVQATPHGEPAAPGGLKGAVAPAEGLESGEVRLSWSAPDDDGSLPITDYVVESSVDGSPWTPVDEELSTGTTTTVGGLTNGTPYRFRVAAVNGVGPGPSSAPIEATPLGEPANPAGFHAAAGVGSGRIRLTWSTPASTGGSAVSDYVIQRSTDGTTWTTVREGVSTARSSIVTGLVNGTQYRFRIAAVNAIGQGPWSSQVRATPVWKPAAPSGLRATAGTGRVRLTWNAPASNGSPVTDYVIQRSAGRRWTTVPDGVSSRRSAVVTKLTNGTQYRFRIAAKNAVGQGVWSAPVRTTPRAR